MRKRMDYYEYYPRYSQMPVEELRRKAEASSLEAQKKGKVYHPVTVQNTRTICQSWWGEAWCDNLERYADYSNRIGRGRRYVCSGAVVDLNIGKGSVQAKVQGSHPRPYNVTVSVDPMDDKKEEEITAKCSRQISSMEDLIMGRFPQEMKDLFFERGGLFPSPREIHFNCSCPDWASMCKHVAAVMYGVGVRLDDNPFYFFELRGLDVDTFIRKAIKDRVDTMLQNAKKKSKRILSDKEAGMLFAGLD